MDNEEKKKKKSFWMILFKRIRISHILILIVLLAANSYAWFIYVNTISNDVDVHVKAWRIDFTDGNTPVTDYVDTNVSAKVVKIIQSYKDTVNKFVWRKE